jgi:hypothetical protein
VFRISIFVKIPAGNICSQPQTVSRWDVRGAIVEVQTFILWDIPGYIDERISRMASHSRKNWSPLGCGNDSSICIFIFIKIGDLIFCFTRDGQWKE